MWRRTKCRTSHRHLFIIVSSIRTRGRYVTTTGNIADDAIVILSNIEYMRAFKAGRHENNNDNKYVRSVDVCSCLLLTFGRETSSWAVFANRRGLRDNHLRREQMRWQFGRRERRRRWRRWTAGDEFRMVLVG